MSPDDLPLDADGFIRMDNFHETDPDAAPPFPEAAKDLPHVDDAHLEALLARALSSDAPADESLVPGADHDAPFGEVADAHDAHPPEPGPHESAEHEPDLHEHTPAEEHHDSPEDAGHDHGDGVDHGH